MIPILYEKTETAFASNGLGRLRDCISCVVTEERNGIYECDFEYPITGAHFDEIRVGRIVAVTHDDTGEIEPFDIVSYERPIDGVVKFHCTHISYRQKFYTVDPSIIDPTVSPEGSMLLLYGNQAQPYNPFWYESDLPVVMKYCPVFDGMPLSVRQFLGGTEGSILDTFGGEYEWNKFTVRLWQNRGKLRDFTIRYGVNMLDYNEQYSIEESYSACVPYWTDGTDKVIGDRQTGSTSTITGRGETIPLDVSDKFESKPTKAQVNTEGRNYLNTNRTAVPVQTITVEFARLQDSMPELSSLMTCRLCDSIRVIFPDYNSSGIFKIVKTEWDVLGDKYEKMELGTLSTTLAEALGISSGGGGGSGTEPDDYVIEQGTSGDWSYRTWNSGKIEAWASHSFGSQSGTSWASQYYKDLTYSLPSGLFSTAPMVIASSGNSSWAVYGASASTSSISLRAVRNANNAAAMTINFYCIKN